ncbi:hypothetical protein ABT404_13000 [Streptomyces hyaluromycini]|uniref:Uncharacterized protein n=1 Tax=Streptomyces hyaluromycini TaxID=1377993 RepID=A0ABV1WUD6_9ACTN
MNDSTALRIRQAFERLTAGASTLTATDQALMQAFERLMHGLSETTDGSLTVVNICQEAGVSRASYYRSPVASTVKEILAAPDVRRPEADELRAEVARLKRQDRELRSDHAIEVRELKGTAAAYANQIQVLALRNAEVEAENAALRQQLNQTATNVTVLPVQP